MYVGYLGTYREVDMAVGRDDDGGKLGLGVEMKV